MKKTIALVGVLLFVSAMFLQNPICFSDSKSPEYVFKENLGKLNGTGKYDSIDGIMVNSNGDIVTLEVGKSILKVFDMNRKQKDSIKLNDDYSCITGDEDGNIYVAGYWKISKYSAEGGLIRSWENKDKNIYDAVNAIAVDKDGNTYITNNGGTMQKYSAEGKLLKVFKDSYYSVIVDKKGNIYASDMYHNIVKMDAQGKQIKKWGGKGKENGKFESFPKLKIDSVGYLYATDLNGKKVHKFDLEGGFISTCFSYGTSENQIRQVTSMYFGKENNMFLVDMGELKIFSLANKQLPDAGKETTKIDPQKKVAVANASGSYINMIVKSDGSLWISGTMSIGAGYEEEGVLLTFAKPTKYMDNVKHADSTAEGIFILKKDNTLWAFGNGIGNGSLKTVFQPIKIMDKVKTFDTGQSHMLALKEDGSVWVWGLNNSGEIGNGKATFNKNINMYYETKALKIMTNVKSIAAGYHTSFAIKNDGSLWAWGWNESGQLGDGTKTDRTKPIKIMEKIIAVDAGADHTAAINAKNELLIWGSNRRGQLGNDTKNLVLKPTKLLDNVKTVKLGDYNTFVIKSDKSLWGWGYNDDGQIGKVTKTSYMQTDIKNEPIRITDNVSNMDASLGQLLIIKIDGSLWGTGFFRVPSFEGIKSSSIPVRLIE